jgi:radical SAM enzyme (TIGR01210 family)
VEKPELSRLMLAQIQRLKEQIEQVQPQVVKVYTSGSFFDPAEVPPDIQEYLIHQVRGKTLIVESRCEYVDLERLSRYVDIIREGGEAGTIVVAIGLETTSDPIREKCIDKGLHFSDYLKTSEAIHKAGGRSRHISFISRVPDRAGST